MGELAVADPKPATEQCSKHKDDLAPAGVDPHQADEGNGQHAAQHARPIPAVIDEQLQGVLKRDQITLGAQKKGGFSPPSLWLWVAGFNPDRAGKGFPGR